MSREGGGQANYSLIEHAVAYSTPDWPKQPSVTPSDPEQEYGDVTTFHMSCRLLHNKSSITPNAINPPTHLTFQSHYSRPGIIHIVE